MNRAELVFHPVGGFLQQQAEAVSSEFLQKFVRVLGVPHLQDLDLQSGLFQHGDSSLGGILTGFIPVVNQHYLFGIAGKQRGVFLCQRGAQGRHRTVKAILMQRNRIHVALHQNHIAKLAFLGKIQGE